MFMVRFFNLNFWVGMAAGAVLMPALLLGGVWVLVSSEDLGLTELDPPNIPSSGPVSLDWEVKRLDGTAVRMAEDAGGQVAVLNFWATWCGPCKAEMPSLEKSFRKHGDRVRFYCISDETAEELEAFRRETGTALPLYRLEGKRPAGFESRGIPATFVVGRDGRVALEHVGSADWAHERVETLLGTLLAQAADGVPPGK